MFENSFQVFSQAIQVRVLSLPVTMLTRSLIKRRAKYIAKDMRLVEF